MINLNIDADSGAADNMWCEFANRGEIGIIACWEKPHTSPWWEGIKPFMYDECVAVAILMSQGKDGRLAAAMVHHGIVYAVPQIDDSVPEGPLGSDPVGQTWVGVYRLADQTRWSLLADSDFSAWLQEAPVPLSEYKVVATRHGLLTDDDPAQRIRQLITKCEVTTETVRRGIDQACRAAKEA